MGDMREVFDIMRERDKQRKERNLALHQNRNEVNWITHTEHHWSTIVNGKRLDFWPSRNKFQYDKKIHCGDVYGFIRNRQPKQSKQPITEP